MAQNEAITTSLPVQCRSKRHTHTRSLMVCRAGLAGALVKVWKSFGRGAERRVASSSLAPVGAPGADRGRTGEGVKWRRFPPLLCLLSHLSLHPYANSLPYSWRGRGRCGTAGHTGRAERAPVPGRAAACYHFPGEYFIDRWYNAASRQRASRARPRSQARCN